VRVPGGDYDAYVESHVRRLEALRRAGIVERVDADRWQIPDGFEARAQAYDAGQGRRASMRVLSAYDLDRQVTSDGATCSTGNWSTANGAHSPPPASAPRCRVPWNDARTN
jgi:hypothetical protein